MGGCIHSKTKDDVQLTNVNTITVEQNNESLARNQRTPAAAEDAANDVSQYRSSCSIGGSLCVSSFFFFRRVIMTTRKTNVSLTINLIHL